MPDVGSPALDLWTQAQKEFSARDYDRAADLLARLVAQHPDDPGLKMQSVRLQYGITLLRLRRTEEGVVQLRLAVKLDPSNPRAHQKLGAGLARLGKDAEALPYFEHAAAVVRDNAEYQWRVGEQYRRLGHLQAARAAIERCLALDPDYRYAAEGLAVLAKTERSRLAPLARAIRRALRG